MQLGIYDEEVLILTKALSIVYVCFEMLFYAMNKVYLSWSKAIDFDWPVLWNWVASLMAYVNEKVQCRLAYQGCEL